MTSSIGDFYIANQIALRGARFLLAGSIMTLAVMGLHQGMVANV